MRATFNNRTKYEKRLDLYVGVHSYITSFVNNIAAHKIINHLYRNVPTFSDRQIWANSADPDQTAPEEQSDQGLHCLQFPLDLLHVLL